ncbi:MAG: A/G-specific adenine glycosylase, partial [Bacteroidetes bacterium]|nr:A/G-specific adenine glycosylase [Bacteroidota bacterium]
IKSDYQLKKWNKQAILHKLTHQHLEINFWIVKLSSSENLSITMNQISDYPMPKALQNFRDIFFSN